MNIKNKDKLLTIFFWILIILGSLSIVLYTIWSTVYKVEPKTLSIINYYNFPVQVSFKNVQDNFEPFQVKTYAIESRESFNINVQKQESTELENIKIEHLKLDPQVIQVVLSETKDYCYFNANIRSLYTSEEDIIKEINILSRNPLPYFIFGVNQQNINIYPGSSVLTENDINFKEVRGHYPIRCGLLSNNIELENTVKTFLNYDHTKQLEFYEQKREEIKNTFNLDLLNSIQ